MIRVRRSDLRASIPRHRRVTSSPSSKQTSSSSWPTGHLERRLVARHRRGAASRAGAAHVGPPARLESAASLSLALANATTSRYSRPRGWHATWCSRRRSEPSSGKSPPVRCARWRSPTCRRCSRCRHRYPARPDAIADGAARHLLAAVWVDTGRALPTTAPTCGRAPIDALPEQIHEI